MANQALDYSHVSTRLSPAQVREAERAFQLPKDSERTASIDSLVSEHIIKNTKPTKAHIKEILTDFIRSKKSENKRQRTISNLEACMNAFLSLSGIQEVTELSQLSLPNLFVFQPFLFGGIFTAALSDTFALKLESF